MPTRHAICLIIDGLRASALGAYGGLGVATPGFDQLAGESIVADWMWTAGRTVEEFYDAVSTRVHPLRRAARSGAAGGDGLFDLLAQRGVRLDLVTDDAEVASRFDAAGNVDVQWLDLPATALASAVGETRFAQLLAIAADHWLSADLGAESRLLWIHAAGWHGPWDAPLEIRESLLAEDGLQPSAAVDVSIDLGSGDLDELLIARTAYAAQTAVIDECLEGFLTAVGTSPGVRETLLAVGGTRGFALGEHGQFGRDGRSYYGEYLHTPLLVRPPGATAPLARDGDMRNPCDIGATFLDWMLGWESAGGIDLGIDGESVLQRGGEKVVTEGRRWGVCLGDGELAIRTPAWMLRQLVGDGGGQGVGLELYAKPDDRWEANEVAARCPEATEGLLAFLAELERAAAADRSFNEVQVPESLVNIWH